MFVDADATWCTGSDGCGGAARRLRPLPRQYSMAERGIVSTELEAEAGPEAAEVVGLDAVAEWVAVVAAAEVGSLKVAADGSPTAGKFDDIGADDIVASTGVGTGANTADIGDDCDDGGFGGNPDGANTAGVAGVLGGTSAELCHLPSSPHRRALAEADAGSWLY